MTWDHFPQNLATLSNRASNSASSIQVSCWLYITKKLVSQSRIRHILFLSASGSVGGGTKNCTKIPLQIRISYKFQYLPSNKVPYQGKYYITFRRCGGSLAAHQTSGAEVPGLNPATLTMILVCCRIIVGNLPLRLKKIFKKKVIWYCDLNLGSSWQCCGSISFWYRSSVCYCTCVRESRASDWVPRRWSSPTGNKGFSTRKSENCDLKCSYTMLCVFIFLNYHFSINNH